MLLMRDPFHVEQLAQSAYKFTSCILHFCGTVPDGAYDMQI